MTPSAFIRHPDSEYAGNAQYWIGECYYTQRDYARALEAFNKVIERYPKGQKVPDALLKVGFSLTALTTCARALRDGRKSEDRRREGSGALVGRVLARNYGCACEVYEGHCSL
jgi:tetratricopeptide (TPR) repeat protein